MGRSRGWLLLALLPSLAWARTWTVDDDRQQCRSADFIRIQDAVLASAPGDRIHVCPGLYEESVTIEKPLSLKGSGPANALLRTGDPRFESVVRPPAGSNGFTVVASDTGIKLFTVWSQQAGVLPDIGIGTGPDSSGDTIEFNAIWEFHNGVELQSNNQQGNKVFSNFINGTPGTTFNGFYGIHLIGIQEDTLVADNVVRHYLIAIAGEPAAPGVTLIRRLQIDRNEISDVQTAISLNSAEDSEINDNRIFTNAGGIGVFESVRINVERNLLESTDVEDFTTGGAINLYLTSDFAVLGNVVRHFTTPIEFDSGAIRLLQSTNGRVERNVVHDVRVGHGIALNGGSNGNLVKGNTTYQNARDGLLVQASSSGNTLEENMSFLNGEFDAEDRNRPNNQWCRNWCQTDNPPGTICMQSDPGCH